VMSRSMTAQVQHALAMLQQETCTTWKQLCVPATHRHLGMLQQSQTDWTGCRG
jgi:hypothetical protein